MRASTGDVLKARFWSRVAVTDGCWEWTGLRMSTGYGRMKVQGRESFAHRISWELAHGPVPEGMIVMHICDNPPCVRPDHLRVGTQSDNIRDMVAKGRGLTAERQAAIRHPRGDDHWTHRDPSRVPSGENHWRRRQSPA